MRLPGHHVLPLHGLPLRQQPHPSSLHFLTSWPSKPATLSEPSVDSGPVVPEPVVVSAAMRGVRVRARVLCVGRRHGGQPRISWQLLSSVCFVTFVPLAKWKRFTPHCLVFVQCQTGTDTRPDPIITGPRCLRSMGPGLCTSVQELWLRLS